MGKITLGNNEPLAQLLDVSDLVRGKRGVHTSENTTSLYRRPVPAFSEVTCVYLFAMRAHAVQIISVKQTVQLLLVKLDALLITKPVRPVEPLILNSFIQQPVSVKLSDHHLHTTRTAADKDVGRPI